MKCLFLIAIIQLLLQCTGKPLSGDDSYQKISEDVKREIAGYSDIAKAIINLAVYGNAKNRSYERLALFADTVGPRLSGSKNLDVAIEYMFSALQEEGLENVHLEPVKVPHWERGEEFALMLAPRSHSISILGLGSSVPTPPEGAYKENQTENSVLHLKQFQLNGENLQLISFSGITAEVLVVSSFDELYKRAEEAKGKIVVYNQPYTSYGETVQYRAQGAVEAAKAGAVASLIRSITSFSINSCTVVQACLVVAVGVVSIVALSARASYQLH